MRAGEHWGVMLTSGTVTTDVAQNPAYALCVRDP